MPLTDYVAVVSLTSAVGPRDLMAGAAAIQKQVTRDFSPHWGIAATVSAFDDLDSVPSDYYPVVLFGDADELVGRLEFALGPERASQLIDEFDGELLSGIHLNAFTRQPFALVAATDTWTVTVSHEVLELIADPYGNHLIAAAHPTDPELRVNYLVEVCDPCLSTWYPVNGLPVSDFYTPRYFDPVRTDGTLYSFTGEIEYPLQVLDGGYVTFVDPGDSGLYQLQFGAREPLLLAGVADLAASSLPLRTLVDNHPRTPKVYRAPLRPAKSAASAAGVYGGVDQAARETALYTVEAVWSLRAGLG
jgi:hypothetical protein